MKTCAQCSQQYKVTDKDLDFFAKISPEFDGKKFPIPEPSMCPDCRSQKRLAFYNRRHLYKRTCDYSREPIISIYSPDKPFKIYEKSIWYSDKWEPMDYGRDFDFSRPFFEQFRELMAEVPMLSLILLGDNNVNSDYNNDNMDLKNCYMTFDGGKGVDSYYGESFVDITDCMDFLFVDNCELCYECINCSHCYNLRYSLHCKNCSDSWFLKDCTGCRNCFGCVNLKQKEFHIYNKPVSKDEFDEFMKNFDTGNYAVLADMKHKIHEFYLQHPVRAVHGLQNENAVGDNLTHCKNAYYCFDSNYLQDCEYCSDSQTGAADSWDIDVWGEDMQLCYNCTVCGTHVRNLVGCYYVSENAHDVYYSAFCSRKVHHLFGCIGLRRNEYCIFNKKYSPEEYEKLVAKIIEHMQKTGEWGEFFPPEISAFAYNETVAQDYYPLTQEDVSARGWQWRDIEDDIPKVDRTLETSQLPPTINDTPDDILHWAVRCEVTGRPFVITEPELKFYRQHQLPIPHFHPDERHKQRMALRNPHHLWKRQCGKCGAEIETSYSPDRPETVYCEKCFLEAVD